MNNTEWGGRWAQVLTSENRQLEKITREGKAVGSCRWNRGFEVEPGGGGGEERGQRAREEKLRRGDGVADGTEMLGLAVDQGNREKRKLGDVVSSWPVEIGEGVEAPRSR